MCLSMITLLLRGKPTNFVSPWLIDLVQLSADVRPRDQAAREQSLSAADTLEPLLPLADRIAGEQRWRYARHPHTSENTHGILW